MVPTLGFNFQQAVEIQSVCKKGFTTGFVWIENRSFVLSWKGKNIELCKNSASCNNIRLLSGFVEQGNSCLQSGNPS